MIAIGILGIGMLMVAATFPVGLDQSRIVSEKTIAPLVAKDAFATIQMLIDDPSNKPRIGDDIPPKLATSYTFRQALGKARFMFGTTEGVLMNLLPNRDILPDFMLINDWLSAPYDTTGGVNPELGAQTRYYPSVPGRPIRNPARPSAKYDGESELLPPSLYTWTIPQEHNGNVEYIDPSYTWSVLIRRVNVPSMGDMNIQFVVFINRRSWQTPVFIMTPLQAVELAYVNISKLQIGGEPALPENFNEGGYLVRNDGEIFTIKSIDTTTRDDPYLILNKNAKYQDPSVPPHLYQTFQPFWFIPADPNSGRSPCIGVYTRTFPLN
jgi:hypothetical protein